jgi:hypothetical protein
MRRVGAGGEFVTPSVLNLDTKWKASGQFNAPAALSPGKDLPASTGYEAGWDPEPHWTL